MRASQLAVSLRGSGKALYLGRNGDEPIFGSPEDHLMVVGPPRSGKTSRLLTPTVAAHAGPVIVVSTRDDLLVDTLHARRDIAEEVGGSVTQVVIGGSHARPGVPVSAWSLAAGCERWDVARDRATSMVHAAVPPSDGDTIWRDAAASALAGCLYGAALCGHTAERMASKIRATDLAQYYEAARALDPEGTHPSTQSFAWAFDDRTIASKTRQSVYFVLRSQVLGSFEFDAVAGEALKLPEFLGSGASSVYLTIPYERRQQGAPVVAAFIEAAVATWRRQGRVARREDGATLLLVLDEAANIAPLPSLPGLLTAGAGDGIQVVFALQDPSQSAAWGHDANAVLGGSRLVSIFPGLRDTDYLQRLADLAEKDAMTDLRVTCSRRWVGGSRRATSERLIRERTTLEHAIAGRHGRFHRRLLLRAVLPIAVERTRDGVRTAKDDTSMPSSVLDEILAFTEVEVVYDRRSPVEVSDLTQGGKDRVVLFAGSRMFNLTATHWREDPLWSVVCGQGEGVVN